MPVYEYAHEKKPCKLGAEFEWTQSIKDNALTACPECGGPVKRLISRVYINTPMSDTDLRDKGFTKLVRRDKGVYENVTAIGDESKVMSADDPSSVPDLKKRIRD